MEKNLLRIAELMREAFQRDWIAHFPNVVTKTCRDAIPLFESLEI